MTRSAELIEKAIALAQAGKQREACELLVQVITADANGVFAYAMPRAGWWSFAALVEGDKQMANPDGEKVPVELGGLIWVQTVDMK